jgi:hypothetical protein
MNLEERLHSLVQLRRRIDTIDSATLNAIYERVGNQNPWFTPANINTALTGVRKLLDEAALRSWLDPYDLDEPTPQKTIALVLAGNVPLVGFHDIMTVFLTGNRALVKASSKDSVLTHFIVEELHAIEPRAPIEFAEQLKNFDAVIATGSDNSSRYFEYYFGKYPSIIRKNRTSCAILFGDESEEQLAALGADVFTYFGLGCRNVSHLFVPEGYDISRLTGPWKVHQDVIHHHKYFNNYEYQKAVFLINEVPFSDTGFVLLTGSDKAVSPVAVLFYEEYTAEEHLRARLAEMQHKIQCVVGSRPPATVPFGQAQFPEPSDYADGVDTILFLQGLNRPVRA